MGNVDTFLRSLIKFDKDNVPAQCVDRVERDFLSQPGFTPEQIRSKSSAAAGLCGWVLNICKYFRIYQVVAPKRATLAEANKRLDASNKKLQGIRARVRELQDRVATLEKDLMKATEEKNAKVAAAERTANKMNIADRLITGLSGENKRWNEAIQAFTISYGKLPGDSLLAAAFVCYAGPFNSTFREQLVSEAWVPDLRARGIPMTDGCQPLDLLTNDAQKAKWANEGLRTDALSIENGAVVVASARWPLLIDPQLQGVAWIKTREADNGLVVAQTTEHKYIDTVVRCIESGLPLLIENLPENLDPVLEPVVARRTYRRGRAHFIKLGDSEVEYNPNFRLYLQTKLANPHYKPEVAAQTTLVNFCVTEAGLQEQLLAMVVDHEQPELQQSATQLVRSLASYTISLQELEDGLLARLANSQGDILDDIELVENLEATKATALDIEAKVAQATRTQAEIGRAREVYRPVAARGALLYFIIDNLDRLDRCYHYSMANFVATLNKGMDITPGGKDESAVPPALRVGDPVPTEQRVQLLVKTTSVTIFQYVAQGLFERHKLIFATQLCVAVSRAAGQLQVDKFDFLLRGPRKEGVPNPVSEWLLNSAWATVQALAQTLEEYAGLPDDLNGAAKRWREWSELERPEEELMPGDWKRMPEFERLLIIRALRPDRLTTAMRAYVAGVLGREYIASQPFDLERSYADARPGVPVFVFLSPGVDVAASVEALGKRVGMTADASKYYAVSLGQGQEPIAMGYLQQCHRNGGWVLLQNIHLTIDWTSGPLVKVVDKLSVGAHPDFRLFLSAEPPPALERALPISLLQASIKLTNEPPEGLKANLKRAYGSFSEELLESCAKTAEFNALTFALAFFHASILERKRFGVGNLPGARSGIGWNMNYPFNTGDLLCAAQTAVNYLDNNIKVPWDDLRYLFGEILYGGHIVEDWDRRLASAYLAKLFGEALLDGPLELFPGFNTPPTNFNRKQTLEYVEEQLVSESPIAFGLHPNVEISFKLREAEAFCEQLQQLQPRGAGGEGGLRLEDKAKQVLDDLTERLPESFNLEDIRGRVDDMTPYTMVAIQECERMNVLLREMRRSLAELDLGLRGDLTMSEAMERLMQCLADDRVPPPWTALAWPSLRSLTAWMSNLLARVAQLVDWTPDLCVPKSVWLPGLFNPQAFLTAVMQTTARKNDWPLDRMVLVTEVTKKQPDQVEGASREGAFVHGLTLEGARWDDKSGQLEDSRPKELFCPMPVMLVRAVPVDKAEARDVYQCPVYTTEARFRQEVFTAQLRSRQPWIKWTLAGVCLFLDVV